MRFVLTHTSLSSSTRQLVSGNTEKSCAHILASKYKVALRLQQQAKVSGHLSCCFGTRKSKVDIITGNENAVMMLMFQHVPFYWSCSSRVVPFIHQKQNKYNIRLWASQE